MPPVSTTTVLAVGAWLKNVACLWQDGRARWSAMHGDLGDPAACEALQASVDALIDHARQSGHAVQAVAHDLHPDFFSTRLALSTADALGVPAIGVQHHHAHIAAIMAEHGLTGSVIGLALDGVGLGTPSGAGSEDDHTPQTAGTFTAWGGELLWLDGPHWARLGHLYPLALPGGDRAAREPWRMAASALHALGRASEIVPRFGPVVGDAVAAGLHQMLDRRLNCPLTSSTGRWFDAAAGALGLCSRQQDEAQAAIALESAAVRALTGQPDLPPLPGARIDALNRLDLRPVLAHLFQTNDVDAAAAGFHLALADALSDWLIEAARARRTQTACLGGGCFFNRILRERVTRRLIDAGLQVYLPVAQGCGDAGLAIGQAWVAAQQLAALPIESISTNDSELCA